MKNEVNDKYTSYDVFLTFINKLTNKALITAILETVAVLALIDLTFGQLTGAIKSQIIVPGGAKDESDKAQEALATTMNRIGMKAWAMADDKDETDLAKQVKRPISYFTGVSKNLCLTRAGALRDVLSNNASVFTNIKPADFTEIDAKILDFKNKRNKPTNVIKDAKAAGTNMIPKYVNTMDKAILKLYGYVFGEYAEDKPEFVEAMALAKKVGHTGVHHTGISAFISEALHPELALLGVQMKIVELDISADSSITGFASISAIMPDTYHIEFSFAGYETQTLVVKLLKGRIAVMNVLMVKSV